jgi:hypothetical protein
LALLCACCGLALLGQYWLENSDFSLVRHNPAAQADAAALRHMAV